MISSQLSAIRDRALRLHQEGRLSEALAAHDEALRLAPGAVGIHLSAARLAHLLGQQQLSLDHFEAVARLDPNCFMAIDSARRICVGAGLSQRAARHSQAAYALQPSPEILLSMKLVLPSILESPGEIAAVRERYRRALHEILAGEWRFEKPEGVLGISGFFLAYHGQNDRELQVLAAQAYLHAMPWLTMTAPHCATYAGPGRRIRVGFISRYFHAHSIFSTSHGLIAKLARDKFEVYALRIMPSADDAATAALRGAAEHTLDLDPDFFKARHEIAALKLDVLFYQDIGMETTSYFLAFARLAPVQCVSFGHPNTTGIPTMDFFVSNDAFETEHAQEHYSESLFALEGLPTLAYYFKPKVPPVPRTPAAFGLPEDCRLYLCPQTLYKVHPDFDLLVQGILNRDPKARVAFIAGQFREFSESLRARLARVLGTDMQRVAVLPRLGTARYLELLGTASVVLDTVHFNGMNSSLECFAVGTPVVTWPTALQRGRHTQAMYKRMDIAEPIADSAEGYVNIAVRIATDVPFAADLRRRILERNHLLFEDPRVITEFERFFVEALARSRP